MMYPVLIQREYKENQLLKFFANSRLITVETSHLRIMDDCSNDRGHERERQFVDR